MPPPNPPPPNPNPVLEMFIKTLKETAERTKKEFEAVQGSLKLANEAYAAAVQKYGKNSAEAQVAADKLNKVGEAYQAALRTAADAHNRLQEVEAMKANKATGALDVFIMALEQAANNTRNHYEKMKAELAKASDAYTWAVKQWGEDSDEAKKAAADLETARNRYEAALNSAALASSKFADAQAKQKAASAPTATAPAPTVAAPSADGGGAVAYLKNMAAVVSDAIKNGIGGSLEYLKGITSTVGQAVRSNLGTAFEKTAVTLAPVTRIATGLGTAFAGVTTAGLKATTTLTTFGKSLSDAGANALRQPMQVLDTAISAVQTNVVRFVSKANPAAVQLFTMAIDDLQAVIGQALLPVLKIATDVFRSVGSMIYGLNGEGKKLIAAVAAGTIGLIAFGAAMVLIQTITTGGIMPIIGALTGVLGGFFAVFQGGAIKSAIDRVMKILGGVMEQVGAAIDRLAPAMEPVFAVLEEVGTMAAAGVAAIAQVWSEVAPVFVQMQGFSKKIFDAIKPILDLGLEIFVWNMTGLIKGVAMALEFLMPFIEAVIKGIKIVADAVAWVVKSIAELLGIKYDGLQAPKSALQKNEGTSVKSASFSDPTADLKKAITSAMTIGLGAQPPEQKTADGVTKIVGQLSPLQTLGKKIQDFFDPVIRIADQIWGGLQKIYGFFAGRVEKTFETWGRWFNQFLAIRSMSDILEFLKAVINDTMAHTLESVVSFFSMWEATKIVASIANGFAETIRVNVDKLFKFLSDIPANIANAIRNFLPFGNKDEKPRGSATGGVVNQIAGGGDAGNFAEKAYDRVTGALSSPISAAGAGLYVGRKLGIF